MTDKGDIMTDKSTKDTKATKKKVEEKPKAKLCDSCGKETVVLRQFKEDVDWCMDCRRAC